MRFWTRKSHLFENTSPMILPFCHYWKNHIDTIYRDYREYCKNIMALKLAIFIETNSISCCIMAITQVHNRLCILLLTLSEFHLLEIFWKNTFKIATPNITDVNSINLLSEYNINIADTHQLNVINLDISRFSSSTAAPIPLARITS